MAYESELEKLKRRYDEKPEQWFAALAEQYRKSGELDVAIEIVREGIGQRPNYVSGHIVLGRCLVDHGDDAEAESVFEHVLELDPENIIALSALGEVSTRNGNADGARRWLERLLEVDPMNDEATEALARLDTLPPAANMEDAVVPPSQPMAVDPEYQVSDQSVAGPDPAEDVATTEMPTASVSSADAGPSHLPEDETVPIEPVVGGMSADVSSEIPHDVADMGEGAPEVARPTDDAMDWSTFEREESGPWLEEQAEGTLDPDDVPDQDTFGSSSLLDERALTTPQSAPRERPSTVSFDDDFVIQQSKDPFESDSDDEIVDDPFGSLSDSDPAMDLPGFAHTSAAGSEPEWADAETSERPAIDMSDLPGHASETPETDGALEPPPDEKPMVQEVPEPTGFGPTTTMPATSLEDLAQKDRLAAMERLGAADPEESAGEDSEAPPTEWVTQADSDEQETAADLAESIASGGAVERGAEPGRDAASSHDDASEPADDDTDEQPMVTETMAQVFAQQGLVSEARAVYERLLAQRPGDAHLEAQLAQLSESVAVGDHAKPRGLAAHDTGGMSARAFLAGVLAERPDSRGAPSPVAAATPDVLGTAFDDDEDDEEVNQGRPTQPAADEVSLSSIFGDEGASSTHAPAASEGPGTAEEMSFDTFFGKEASSEPDESEGPAEREDADDEDFKQWLQGLKS